MVTVCFSEVESASKGEDSSNLIPCQTETRFLETKRDSLTWGINYSLSLFVYVCFFVSSRKFSIVIVCLLLSSSVVPEKSYLLTPKWRIKQVQRSSFIGLRHWPRKPWYSPPSRRGLSKIQIRRADGDILTHTTAVSHKINLHCIYIYILSKAALLFDRWLHPTNCILKRCPSFFFMFSMWCLFHILFPICFIFPSRKEALIGSVPNESSRHPSPSTWNRWATSSPGVGSQTTRLIWLICMVEIMGFHVGKYILHHEFLGGGFFTNPSRKNMRKSNWDSISPRIGGKHKKYWNHHLDFKLF